MRGIRLDVRLSERYVCARQERRFAMYLQHSVDESNGDENGTIGLSYQKSIIFALFHLHLHLFDQIRCSIVGVEYLTFD